MGKNRKNNKRKKVNNINNCISNNIIKKEEFEKGDVFNFAVNKQNVKLIEEILNLNIICNFCFLSRKGSENLYCNKCGIVRYCSTVCQRDDILSHSKYCSTFTSILSLTSFYQSIYTKGKKKMSKFKQCIVELTKFSRGLLTIIQNNNSSIPQSHFCYAILLCFLLQSTSQNSIYQDICLKISKSLSNIGTTLFHKEEYSTALLYYEKVIMIHKKIYDICDHYDIASDYFHIGVIHQNLGNYSQALQILTKALEMAQRIPEDMEIEKFYYHIGIVYQQQGNYSKALFYLEQSLRIDLKKENHHDIATTYQQIGSIVCSQGNYSKALFYLGKSIQLLKYILSEKDNLTIAGSYYLIGIVYQYQGNYSAAFENYKLSFQMRKRLLGKIDHTDIAKSYHQLGMIYERWNNYIKAEKYYTKSLEMKIRINGENNHPEIASTYHQLGKIHQDQGNYQRAVIDYEKSLEINKKIHGMNHPDIAKTFALISEVHFQEGNYEKVLEENLNCYNIAKETENYRLAALTRIEIIKFQLLQAKIESKNKPLIDGLTLAENLHSQLEKNLNFFKDMNLQSEIDISSLIPFGLDKHYNLEFLYINGFYTNLLNEFSVSPQEKYKSLFYFYYNNFISFKALLKDLVNFPNITHHLSIICLVYLKKSVRLLKIMKVEDQISSIVYEDYGDLLSSLNLFSQAHYYYTKSIQLFQNNAKLSGKIINIKEKIVKGNKIHNEILQRKWIDIQITILEDTFLIDDKHFRYKEIEIPLTQTIVSIIHTLDQSFGRFNRFIQSKTNSKQDRNDDFYFPDVAGWPRLFAEKFFAPLLPQFTLDIQYEDFKQILQNKNVIEHGKVLIDNYKSEFIPYYLKSSQIEIENILMHPGKDLYAKIHKCDHNERLNINNIKEELKKNKEKILENLKVFGFLDHFSQKPEGYRIIRMSSNECKDDISCTKSFEELENAVNINNDTLQKTTEFWPFIRDNLLQSYEQSSFAIKREQQIIKAYNLLRHEQSFSYFEMINEKEGYDHMNEEWWEKIYNIGNDSKHIRITPQQSKSTLLKKYADTLLDEYQVIMKTDVLEPFPQLWPWTFYRYLQQNCSSISLIEKRDLSSHFYSFIKPRKEDLPYLYFDKNRYFHDFQIENGKSYLKPSQIPLFKKRFKKV